MKAIIQSGDDTPRQCPVCHSLLDAYTGVSLRPHTNPDLKPAPGSITICAGCASTLVFTDTDTGLRVATQDDLEGLPAETQDLLAKLSLFVLERQS